MNTMLQEGCLPITTQQEKDRNRNNRKPSVSTRLFLHRPNKIQQLRSEIPTSEYALPKLGHELFPRFEERLVEEKYPHVQGLEQDLYYSRGKLGQKVMRQKNVSFSVDDEYNLRKIVISPYDPLHDPHLAHYLKRPIIKHHLEAQGFLKDEHDVVCSLKNFNEFRKYLGVNQNDQVSEFFRKKNIENTERQREMKELSALSNAKKEAQQKASERAIAKRNALLEKRRNQLLGMFKDREIRRAQAKITKNNSLKEHLGSKLCRHNMLRIAYDRVKLPNIDERQIIMTNILHKELAVVLRLAVDKIAKHKFKELSNLNKIHKWIGNQKNALGELSRIQDIFEMKLQTKARKYEERMSNLFNQLPALIQKRRDEKRRLDAVVRKYFYRWLNKVRKRRERRQKHQDCHLSHWDVTSGVDNMNDTLCGQDRVKIVDMKTLIQAAKLQHATAAQLHPVVKSSSFKVLRKKSASKHSRVSTIDPNSEDPKN